MSDATIVAIVILGGVFVVMSITIWRAGVEEAVKLWSVMGALTGVAFGGITSYYFTNKANHQEIRRITAEKAAIELALNSAAYKAMEANRYANLIAAVFRGDQVSTTIYPVSSKIFMTIPESEKTKILYQMDGLTKQLKDIRELQSKITKNVPIKHKAIDDMERDIRKQYEKRKAKEMEQLRQTNETVSDPKRKRTNTTPE